MSDRNVRPPVTALTEADARHLIASGLLKSTHEQGPTRVGLTIGCDEKTVRKARDKHSTLRVDYSWNALLADPHALDPLANHFGLRLVPIYATCDTDALPTTAAAVHKLAVARAPDSPGGETITHCELLGMEAEIDAALRALTNLKLLCGKARAA